jgi:hypothetical protein
MPKAPSIFAHWALIYRQLGLWPRPVTLGSKACHIKDWQRPDGEIGRRMKRHFSDPSLQLDPASTHQSDQRLKHNATWQLSLGRESARGPSTVS